MLTSNQVVLAKIYANQAINRAKRPPELAHKMLVNALHAAIQSKADEVHQLIIAGKIGSIEYERATEQLRSWNTAWAANR